MGSNIINDDILHAAVNAYKTFGSKALAADHLNIPRTTLTDRLNLARRKAIAVPEFVSPPAKGRLEMDLINGVVLVASDCHYWPGEPSTAHRALVRFCEREKIAALVMNGDICDFAGISRFPPRESIPTVEQEIEAAMERMDELVKASKRAKRFFTLGNHDARLEVYLITRAPELRGLKGTSLADWFPDWSPCWSVWINNKPGGLVIKHRAKGGIHSPWHNVINSGRSMATGHLHSQKIYPFTDYNGTRWGVDTGCIADPFSDAFQYQEDTFRNHRSGFAKFTFKDGKLLTPELIRVVEPGVVEYRAELIEV